MLLPNNQLNYIRVYKNKGIGVFLIFITLIVLSTGCDKKTDQKQISQGVILYDIKYINQVGKKFPVQLMPKSMKLIFNKDFSSYTIEDRLGLFSIKNIFNYKENQHTTQIKVFDKKYVYIGLPKESAILFDSAVDYTVQFMKDTLRLAGFTCKRAAITDKNSTAIFNVYYTEGIVLENPNKNTPYEDITGMLLNFRLHLKSLDMELNATKFEHTIVENTEFSVQEGYKQISRKQMEDIITTILP